MPGDFRDVDGGFCTCYVGPGCAHQTALQKYTASCPRPLVRSGRGRLFATVPADVAALNYVRIGGHAPPPYDGTATTTTTSTEMQAAQGPPALLGAEMDLQAIVALPSVLVG